MNVSDLKLSEESGYRWVILVVSLSAFISFAFALQLIPPLMPLIIEEFDVGHARAGLLMSMVVIPGVLLTLPAGLFVDRHGALRTGVLSTVLIAFGCLLTAIAGSFGMALVGRLVLGIGGAFVVTSMPTIIPQWFARRELGLAMGIYGVNMPLASIVAFGSASVLSRTLGWRYLFYVAASVAVACTAIVALLAREGPFKGEHPRKRRIGDVLGNLEIWKLGVVWLLFNAGAMSFSTWGPKVFQDFHAMGPVEASLMASALMWAAIPCVPFFGWFSDRIGKRRILMVTGPVLMASAFVAIANTSGPSLTASVIALGVFAALVPPIVMTMPPEILGPAGAGTGFGVVGTCVNVGIAAAPPLTGLLIDLTGSPTPSFLTMGLFSVLAAGVAYTLKSK